MKPGQIRHRVFGRFLGRVALINVFPDPDAAEKLTSALRARYGRHGAQFWHTTTGNNKSAEVPWAPLRAALQALDEPQPGLRRLPQEASDRLAKTAMRKLRETQTSEEEIRGYLARGGAITIARAHRGTAPSGRRRQRPGA